MKELSADAQAALIVAAILLFVFSLGIVGRSDFEDAVAQEEFYESMVCKGLWPDYNHLGVECEDTKREDAGSEGAVREGG